MGTLSDEVAQKEGRRLDHDWIMITRLPLCSRCIHHSEERLSCVGLCDIFAIKNYDGENFATNKMDPRLAFHAGH